MSLIPETPPVDPNAPPAAAPAPTPTPTPAPAPAEGEDPPAEKPDWLPDSYWKDGKFDAEAFDALAARPEPQADVPEKPEDYKLPEIEGFDAEIAGASPLFEALRRGAHANKIGQAAFEGIISDYVEAEIAKGAAAESAEMAKLGKDGESRVAAVGAWLDRTFSAERAAALRAAATTASGVEALEEMMNGQTSLKPRDDPPPPAQKDTKETIEALMRTKEYRGKEHELDPAVIKRVDDWFAANAKPKARK